MRRTADYAAVVASTTSDDVIAVCDSGSDFRRDTLAILTELVPDSYWTTLLHKQQAAANVATPIAAGPALPAYILLPEIGYMASTRALGDHLVKIFVVGNKADAGHTHEDKGSFVLEYAGQAFALDLGIGDYGDPIHVTYKHCQRHNMLVPVGTSERTHPANPLPFDIKPTGRGDERMFHAQIDVTPGWNGAYKKWVRTWDSPSPETLTIRDEYELAQGDTVEFYWQTRLPVEQTDSGLTIRRRQRHSHTHRPARLHRPSRPTPAGRRRPPPPASPSGNPPPEGFLKSPRVYAPRRESGVGRHALRGKRPSGL